MKQSLSPSSVTQNLGTCLIGQRVICYPTLPSSNELAKEIVRQGAVEGTVIVAEEQTTGKGRFKRAWISPRGSLSLSIILYPSLKHLPSIIMVASLAVVHSIETVIGLEAQIKWPNDVLINGKKVCGILVESEVRGSVVGYAIVGIGMNVNLRITDFSELLPAATSISHELGREVSLLGLVKSLLVQIERLYLALLGGESIYEEWRSRLATLGKEVCVVSGEVTYSGIAESVARDGSLLVRRPDSSLITIVAGDVTLQHQA